MKIIKHIVDLIFWLWAFIIPAAILGFFAFLLYRKSASNLPYSVLMAIAGIIIGAVLAEYIRRKYGLDYFFGKLLSTPELEDTNNKKTNSEKE